MDPHLVRRPGQHLIAFVTIIIDMIIGMSYGLISGYFGGVTDSIMQRFLEVANSVPRLVIVSVLAIFMAKGWAW